MQTKIKRGKYGQRLGFVKNRWKDKNDAWHIESALMRVLFSSVRT